MSPYRGRPRIPDGGIKATLCGGNTIGGTIREREARADGYRHLDTPALVRRLVEMNVNTYLYGVWDSPTDWDDLRLEFLPAARTAGIDVIPYIVPPSETTEDGRASRPFMTDYVRWAEEIARLSLEFENLRSWAIDDFEVGDNALLFTPEYMTAVRETQQKINPELGFYTCAYMAAATSPEFLDKYGPFIDGIIYPFLDGHAENTTVADSVTDCVEQIRRHTDPRDLRVILLIYSGRFLAAPLPPTEDYVRATVRAGRELAARGVTDGVIAYGTQQDGAPAPNTDNRAMYGNGRLAIFASRSAIAEGSSASGAQRVRVDPTSPRYEFSFWYRREFVAPGLPPDTFRLEVLFDDAVVWTADLAEQNENLWYNGDTYQGPVDVTEHVRGRPEIELTFRVVALRDVRGVFFDLGIDNIQTVGLHVVDPGFAEPGAWTVSRSGALVGTVDLFAPDRPARILATLRAEFGAGAGS